MKKIAYLIALVLVVYIVYAQVQNAELQSQLKQVEEQLAEKPIAEVAGLEEESDYDLVGSMGKLQYFANKLYYSLENKNPELIEFYTHEIEETMEATEEAQVYDDGVDVSKNMGIYGIKGLENFEKFMDQNPDDFKNHYKNLINTCNACHLASEHGFIEITIPSSPVVSNQNFAKK